MLTRDQSDAAADALLSEDRRSQLDKRAALESGRRKLIAHQRAGLLGLAGFAIGAGLGYLFLDTFTPAAYFGLGSGYLAGKVLFRGE